jgi:hypothetical protein
MLVVVSFVVVRLAFLVLLLFLRCSCVVPALLCAVGPALVGWDAAPRPLTVPAVVFVAGASTDIMSVAARVAAEAEKQGVDPEAVLNALHQFAESAKAREARGKPEKPNVVDARHQVHNHAPLCWCVLPAFVRRVALCWVWWQ